MKNGKTNFARALDYLRANGFIHNQKDLADRIGSTPTTISRNKHGIVGRADEETIAKFHAVFGHIINVAYLRGESDKMLIEDLSPEEKRNIGVNFEDVANNPISNGTDTNSLINAALAAKDETIMSLKRELATKNDFLATLRAQLADKDNLIAGKERYILELEQKIYALSSLSHLEDPKKDDTHGCPYPLEVAERNPDRLER